MRWLVALALLGCGHAAQAQDGPPQTPATQEIPMDNGAHSPTGEPHPGKIVHDDKVDGRTYTKSASEVPQSIAWVEVDGAWKAVVRIEITGTKEQRRITKFGVDGHELETTIQAPPPPPRPSPGQ